MLIPNEVEIKGRIYKREEETEQTEKIYWRVKHDPTYWRPNLPEVFPFFPNHAVKMTKAIQLMTKAINPLLNAAELSDVFHYKTAFTNHQGLEKPNDPRADWWNNKNTDKEPPRQEVLCCGGTILTELSHDDTWLYPMYIDANKILPTFQEVIDNHLLFDALCVDMTPNGIALRRFPQGNGLRVHILLLAGEPIRIKKTNVERVYPPFPSPYRYP